VVTLLEDTIVMTMNGKMFLVSSVSTSRRTWQVPPSLAGRGALADLASVSDGAPLAVPFADATLEALCSFEDFTDANWQADLALCLDCAQVCLSDC
jgi:hypothetical protein